MQSMHATQATHRRQRRHRSVAAHMRMSAQRIVRTLQTTPALPTVAALPATATLPAVSALPATAALAAVPTLPATAALADVAVLPATATLWTAGVLRALARPAPPASPSRGAATPAASHRTRPSTTDVGLPCVAPSVACRRGAPSAHWPHHARLQGRGADDEALGRPRLARDARERRAPPHLPVHERGGARPLPCAQLRGGPWRARSGLPRRHAVREPRLRGRGGRRAPVAAGRRGRGAARRARAGRVGAGFSWRDPEGNVWDVAWARDAVLDERGGVAFP